VGKVALDIICDTAFGYKTDCLHNPHNELAVAFEQLLQLQSGPNLAKLVAILSIPGTSSLSRSQWMYRHRWFLGKLPIIHNFEKLVDSLYRIRTISREMLRSKTADLSVSPDDTTTKKDIMSLLVRARKADLDADPTADAMSDTAMVDQVLTFLAAGHECVSYFLCLHNDLGHCAEPPPPACHGCVLFSLPSPFQFEFISRLIRCTDVVAPCEQPREPASAARRGHADL
jgi:cytochrome P450